MLLCVMYYYVVCVAILCVAMHYYVLLCVAMHYYVLLCVAMCCYVLLCDCYVLLCVAMHPDYDAHPLPL